VLWDNHLERINHNVGINLAGHCPAYLFKSKTNSTEGEFMKIQVKDIQSVFAGINEAAEIGLPAKLNYWLARTAKQLGIEMQTLQESRQKLLEEHAKKDDEGKPVILVDKDDEGKDKPETQRYDLVDEAAFTAAFESILEEEIEITMDALKPELFDELEEKGILMPVKVTYKLLPLFEE